MLIVFINNIGWQEFIEKNKCLNRSWNFVSLINNFYPRKYKLRRIMVQSFQEIKEKNWTDTP